MRRFFRQAAVRFAAVWIAAIAIAAPAFAQRSEPLPDELEGVDIVEKLGAQVPLDLTFEDEDGKTVRLGDLFDGETPRVLNLGYYRCPMLCGLVLNGLVEAMQGMEWTPGGEFGIITASIDPGEGPALARLKKQNTIKGYGRPSAASGWTFLTGTDSHNRALADAVGFGYKLNENRGEYAHGACLVILTPDGRVSRYLYGVQFDPQTLRLSLVEANEGRTASTLDRVILYCFHYDAEEGSYALAAMNLMRAGGILAALVLGSVLAVFWMRDTRRRHEGTDDAAQARSDAEHHS